MGPSGCRTAELPGQLQNVSSVAPSFCLIPMCDMKHAFAYPFGEELP